jgi:diguanylate cyclase (GGDEF)-like protein
MKTSQVRRFDRPVLLAAVSLILVTLVLLPFGRIQEQPTVSFMPALVSLVAGFDLLSVYLLVGGYRDRGDKRQLMMAATYAWSLLIMAGYALAFPGALSQDPPLATTASTAPYLYVIWHTTFPILLALAYAPWPGRVTRLTPPADRVRVVATVLALVLVGAVALDALVVMNSERLPALIVGVDTSRMTILTAPVALPLVLAALVVCYRGTRDRTGPERWATIVILTCLCDLVLTYAAGHRYSVGWYAGRSLTLLASGLLVVSMLSIFRRLSALAERDAAHDPLTDLLNRRSASLALDQLIERARRSGQPLSLVSLDLDHFKRINDTHGHEAGDTVLAAVAAILTTSCRATDLVARVGGEEFLLVLHDTDEAGALRVAEKVRQAISDTLIPALAEPLTASLGVTSLRLGDRDQTEMLRRADRAMYHVKETGRDRVAVAPTKSVPVSGQVGVTVG